MQEWSGAFAHAATAIPIEALCLRARDISLNVARRKFRFHTHEAEDVAQEMALRALIRAQTSEVTPGWIYTGATFICIDQLRKTGFRSRTDDILRHHFVETAQPVVDERLLDVRHAMKKLPEAAQETLWQHFWEGRTWAEIDASCARGKRKSQYRAKKSLALLAEFFAPSLICNQRASRV
jgi:DNA-directed RNA polymerase specialized sigma24 family protein